MLGLIAVVAFVAPLFEESTKDDPTGGAGISAPIVALCTAAVLLSQAMTAGGMQFRRIPGLFVGIGSIASAYLWIAAEARVNPFDPELPLVLGILLAAAAVATISVPLLYLSGKPRPNNQSPSEGNEPSHEDDLC